MGLGFRAWGSPLSLLWLVLGPVLQLRRLWPQALPLLFTAAFVIVCRTSVSLLILVLLLPTPVLTLAVATVITDAVARA